MRDIMMRDDEDELTAVQALETNLPVRLAVTRCKVASAELLSISTPIATCKLASANTNCHHYGGSCSSDAVAAERSDDLADRHRVQKANNQCGARGCE